MTISSRNPEGIPHRCFLCGADFVIEPSDPPVHVPCPRCGYLIWPVDQKVTTPATAGNFTLINRIGEGASGEVWRATSQGGIEVAVKVGFRTLDKEESQGELRALELLKNLRHPYLLQTHAFWMRHGRLHIAMELADGNLRDRLKQCRQEGLPGIPVAELIRYFRQAAEALDFLHCKQVLHGNLKPENILLLEGFAKVADFGLAPDGSGTPAYMAPEMWAGKKASKRCDQYGLAATYAEMCLGRWPISGRGLMEIMREHLEGVPDLAPLPKPEQRVLLKALAKDPEKRFPSCQSFAQEVERVVVR
jgi:serine/threonine protein kinase